MPEISTRQLTEIGPKGLLERRTFGSDRIKIGRGSPLALGPRGTKFFGESSSIRAVVGDNRFPGTAEQARIAQPLHGLLLIRVRFRTHLGLNRGVCGPRRRLSTASRKLRQVGRTTDGFLIGWLSRLILSEDRARDSKRGRGVENGLSEP